MSSLILPRANRLIYPGGNPGFDPSHPAAKGISPGSGVSVVSTSSGLVSALTGQPLTANSQSGVQVGSKLLNGIGFGSGVTSFSSSSYSLSGQSTASISGVTLAAILFNNGSTPSQGTTLIALGPAAPQLLLWISSTYGFYGGSSGPFSSADVFTSNIPIFYAVSATTAGTVNIVARNLATGKILTQYTTSTTVSLGAPTGTVVIGNNAATGGGSPWLNGFVAGAMYAPSFLSMQQLLAWSQDPWSFWYPQKFDLGATLSPPKRPVTNSIGTASRDYSTLALWEAALPANLVTDGNSYVGECYNDSEFLLTSGTVLLISGITTDSTHTITLKCAAGQSFRDNANVQTNALRYNQSNGVGIRATGYTSCVRTDVPYVTFDGLQITTQQTPALWVHSGHCVVQNCIVQYEGAGDGCALILGGNTAVPNSQALNCVVISMCGAGPSGGGIYVANDGLHVIANCTIVKPSDASTAGVNYGIRTNSGGHYGGLNKVVNTAVFGFADFTDDTSNFGSSGNNCTDVAGTHVPGSSNQVSKTYASQFQNTLTSTADFRAKSGGALIDNGATDTTDIPSATDIVGTSRPQGSAWDIGAWELVAAGGTRGLFFNSNLSLGAGGSFFSDRLAT